MVGRKCMLERYDRFQGWKLVEFVEDLEEACAVAVASGDGRYFMHTSDRTTGVNIHVASGVATLS